MDANTSIDIGNNDGTDTKGISNIGTAGKINRNGVSILRVYIISIEIIIIVITRPIMAATATVTKTAARITATAISTTTIS